MTTDPKTCIACSTELNKGARLCHACGSAQKFWRNELKYWATVAGVFSIIAATIGYSIRVAPEIRKTLFWQDSVEILRFSEMDGYTAFSIANTGDGPVWIEKLTYQAHGTPEHIVDVAMTIEVNDVLNERADASVSGGGVYTNAVKFDKENVADALNRSIDDEHLSTEFVTNPDPILIAEGFGIPGTVTVRYLSLKTNDFQAEEKDLFAILYEVIKVD